MVKCAANFGYEDICRLAKEWGVPRHEEIMLINAARSGRMDLCKLALEWGAHNFDKMLLGSIPPRSVEIAQMAKDLGAKNLEFFYYMCRVNFWKEGISLAEDKWGLRNPNARV
jgi:hypothetical protein